MTAWVTLAASNTAEGTRTLQVTGSWTPQPAMALTTTGAGPVVVTLARPGPPRRSRSPSPPRGGPAGPVVGTAFARSPYGSVVLRLGTAANPAAFDCVTGAVDVDDAGRRAVLRIPLTARARQLMAAKRQVRVRVELDPAQGRTITRTVPLRRA